MLYISNNNNNGVLKSCYMRNNFSFAMTESRRKKNQIVSPQIPQNKKIELIEIISIFIFASRKIA